MVILDTLLDLCICKFDSERISASPATNLTARHCYSPREDRFTHTQPQPGSLSQVKQVSKLCYFCSGKKGHNIVRERERERERERGRERERKKSRNQECQKLCPDRK